MLLKEKTGIRKLAGSAKYNQTKIRLCFPFKASVASSCSHENESLFRHKKTNKTKQNKKKSMNSLFPQNT